MEWPLSRVIVGFSYPWGGGCIGNIFAEVEFKCLLAATIGGLEFEKDGKREAVVRGAHGETPGAISISVREVGLGRISRLFRGCSLSRNEERMEGWKDGRMEGSGNAENHVRSLDHFCLIYY